MVNLLIPCLFPLQLSIVPLACVASSPLVVDSDRDTDVHAPSGIDERFTDYTGKNLVD